MRVAVVFDTPYAGWEHSDHERQMLREVGVVCRSHRDHGKLEVLPITGMLFDKRKSRPEERNATQLANANPFTTYGHDMTNAAAKAGMEYADFIQRIVDAALTRDERA
jgi:hypothetical protein